MLNLERVIQVIPLFCHVSKGYKIGTYLNVIFSYRVSKGYTIDTIFHTDVSKDYKIDVIKSYNISKGYKIDANLSYHISKGYKINVILSYKCLKGLQNRCTCFQQYNTSNYELNGTVGA